MDCISVGRILEGVSLDDIFYFKIGIIMIDYWFWDETLTKKDIVEINVI
jgi:hypothetical protein